jgi:tRNA(Ile2)-agmatinylcytidine synthase
VTIVGLDDTDSRQHGMCTTYVAARIAADLLDEGVAVQRLILIRLNPAVPHKTRGNAALAIHTDAQPEEALSIAGRWVSDAAITQDRQTNPGVVVAPGQPEQIPADVARFAEAAITTHHEIEDAEALIEKYSWSTSTAGNRRGLIGALAAIGAWVTLDEWTYEFIAYRHSERRGSPRQVDRESLFAAADTGYPQVWDTVDREADEAVCVPHTPGPILYGIRGDDLDAVREVAEAVEAEPIERTATFVTNQGTDTHLQPGSLSAEIHDDHAYTLEGTVVDPPQTKAGGHVHFVIGESGNSLPCVAFEPTKRFRDHVRALREGDRVRVCGEVTDGVLKLEKFAVRDLVRTERVNPVCPECGRNMQSAGRDQGYRCPDCSQRAETREQVELTRGLREGWYEVPPRARRHIAKPLIRGGFDAPTHPER